MHLGNSTPRTREKMETMVTQNSGGGGGGGGGGGLVNRLYYMGIVKMAMLNSSEVLH